MASENSPSDDPLMPITTARSAGRHRPLRSLHRLVFDFRFFNRSHTLPSQPRQSAEVSDQGLETW